MVRGRIVICFHQTKRGKETAVDGYVLYSGQQAVCCPSTRRRYLLATKVNGPPSKGVKKRQQWQQNCSHIHTQL